MMSYLLLKKELEKLNKEPVKGFSAGLIYDDDIYRWEVLLIGPPATFYEFGLFKAHIYFPKDYPFRPPKMKFITEIWHPNIDKNGYVDIPMLHEPGKDGRSHEMGNEMWLPTYSVEAIVLTVISMMADPFNFQSVYSNFDAAKEWWENSPEFKRKVCSCVHRSQEEI